MYTHNVCMIKVTLYLSGSQLEMLRKYSDISVSEHIRRALDNYAVKLESNRVSNSPSKNLNYEN